MIAPYELADGRLSVGQVRIGKRVFVGNSGMVGQGLNLPKGSLVGVLSAAPRKAKRNKSYLGMPPERLRRASQDTDSSSEAPSSPTPSPSSNAGCAPPNSPRYHPDERTRPGRRGATLRA
jgi:hypothetical protein